MGTRVQWKGMDGLLTALTRSGREAGKVAGRAINEEAQLVFRDSQRMVPYRTGALRASGRIEGPYLLGSSVEVEITYGNTAAQYAQLVHDGTQAHVIEPRNGRALKFVIGRTAVYARRVQHPGTTGIPYLRKPLEDAAPEMDERIARRIGRMIGGGAA